ncbi:MAG: DUF4160 domain-containing protein [Pseudomonadota bacterium]
MPTLLIWRGFKFRFYSSDASEPPHVHIAKDGKSAKVWLKSLELASNNGYTEQEIRKLIAIIADNRSDWLENWNEFFGI